MKKNKLIALSISALIISFLLVPLVLKKEIHISKSVNIGTDPVSIYQEISDLNNWHNWFALSEKDYEIRYVEDSSQNGHSKIYWKKSGYISGTIEITSVILYQSMTFNLVLDHFGTMPGSFTIEPNENYSSLTLRCEIKDLKYPMGRWKGLLIPGFLSKSFIRSLENINKRLMY